MNKTFFHLKAHDNFVALKNIYLYIQCVKFVENYAEIMKKPHLQSKHLPVCEPVRCSKRQ